ncbi:MAG: hypothetical protein K1W39_16660 [Lachnospiraceae bacterium]
MSLLNFLFEFEGLELQAEIINATFSFCYDELSAQSNKQARMVIDGLFNQIHMLTNQMDELMQKGWEEVKKE